VVTGSINGFYAIEDGARLRGVKEGPLWRGELRHEDGSLRCGAGWCGEAECGEIRWRCGRGQPAWGGRES
jgi:hypothetical protein